MGAIAIHCRKDIRQLKHYTLYSFYTETHETKSYITPADLSNVTSY